MKYSVLPKTFLLSLTSVVPLYTLSNEKPEQKLIRFYCPASELESLYPLLLPPPPVSTTLNFLFMFIRSKFCIFHCLSQFRGILQSAVGNLNYFLHFPAPATPHYVVKLFCHLMKCSLSKDSEIDFEPIDKYVFSLGQPTTSNQESQ